MPAPAHVPAQEDFERVRRHQFTEQPAVVIVVLAYADVERFTAVYQELAGRCASSSWPGPRVSP